MIEDRARLGEVASELGEHDAAASPLEQRLTELVLERLNLTAHRRLRDAEPLGGARDVLLLRHGDEVLQLLQAHRVDHAAVRRRHRDRNGIGRRAAAIARCARMAITILSPVERDRMRRAGRAAAATLAYVGVRLAPGMTTAEIDRMVRAHTDKLGGRPSQLGYHGFPAAVCVSRNDIVCHGVPSPNVRLADGDIVNIDVTTELDGYHGDTSATFVIGDAASSARRLVELARGARDAGIAAALPGARLGDIGAAIASHVGSAGRIVEAYGGHGIGRAMHMDPHVSHVGRAHTGHRLREGMAFTVEPMINAGAAAIRTDADGWTVRTADGALSAQFEHRVDRAQRPRDHDADDLVEWIRASAAPSERDRAESRERSDKRTGGEHRSETSVRSCERSGARVDSATTVTPRISTV